MNTSLFKIDSLCFFYVFNVLEQRVTNYTTFIVYPNHQRLSFSTGNPSWTGNRLECTPLAYPPVKAKKPLL